MDAQELRNLQEAYMDVYNEAWRHPKRVDIYSTQGKAVLRHLNRSGSTRNPSPANLAHRENQARKLENRADNIEKSNRFAHAWHGTELWKTTPKEQQPRMISGQEQDSSTSKLRDKAKAIRAVTRAQTRRTATDVDNQRIANDVQRQGYEIAMRGTRTRPQHSNTYDRATSHLDLSKVDPDTYGTPRRTKPKSNRSPKPKSNRSPKPKSIGKNNIVKFNREDIEYVISHLLDEGYAETPEAAEAIMVNMSEGWRDSIIG